MNYCFRDWVTGFANGGSPSNFDSSYNQFKALFPQPTFHAMMNLISTHDSPRMLSLLNEDKAKLKVAVLTQMTLPGAPSVYYGDEVAVAGQSDPDNRRVYPWADTSGGMNNFPADMGMYNTFKQLIGARNSYQMLRRGEVATALLDDVNGVYSYVRWDESGVAVVAIHNVAGAVTTTIPVSSYLADGDQLVDVLNGGVVTVSGGNVTVSVDGQWGVILVKQVLPASAATATADDITISWNIVDSSCEYNVYRHTSPYFDPTTVGTLLNVTPLPTNTTAYIDANALGDVNSNYYYIAIAVNCSSGVDIESNEVGEFDFAVVPGS